MIANKNIGGNFYSAGTCIQFICMDHKKICSDKYNCTHNDMIFFLMWCVSNNFKPTIICYTILKAPDRR